MQERISIKRKGGIVINIFELFATISLKDDGFTSGINKAKDLASSAATSISKFGSVANDIFMGVGKVAAVGLGAATTAFAGLSIKALNLGGELEQNLGGAEAVFGEFADTVKQKGKEAFEVMGASQSDYLANINKMGALLQGSGFDVEQSMDISIAAMQRAADIASVMGISTEEALYSITGAAKGNFTMINLLVRHNSDVMLSAGERYQRCA